MTCGKLVFLSAEKYGCANVAHLLSAAGLQMGVLAEIDEDRNKKQKFRRRF